MTAEQRMRYRCGDCGWTREQDQMPHWCPSCGYDRFSMQPILPPPAPAAEPAPAKDQAA